jgi:hypothetical protein
VKLASKTIIITDNDLVCSCTRVDYCCGVSFPLYYIVPIVFAQATRATELYEYGWAKSFHFSRFYKNESFAASLARHEHFLAAKMNIRPSMRVLDVGCGVGGPAREIARFTDATLVPEMSTYHRPDSLSSAFRVFTCLPSRDPGRRRQCLVIVASSPP